MIKATLSIVIISILSVFTLDSTKKERVFYLPFDIPGSQMAATIPPLGIFIEEKYRGEGEGPGSILAHERIHWHQQYCKMGLVRFYSEYIDGYLEHGRKHGHPMEVEARKLSK